MKAKGIFIGGNTPSSKNSKTMVFKDGRDKPLLLNSKAVMAYKKKSKLAWLEGRQDFQHLAKDLSLPLRVGIHFKRKSKHKYDWINMCQIIQDLMVEYKWIEDDNTDFLIPIPFKLEGSYSTYDKENPGCWIVPITDEILKQL